MKKFLVACSLILCSFINAQNVNPFTGSFSYNFPIFKIPSNRGKPVSIEANYRAGIQMNQPASEIGLGWDLNAGGAIYRSVSGVPDDCPMYLIPAYSPTSSTAYGQGALFTAYNSTASVRDHDLLSTKRGLDTTEFTFPDYDGFTVVAPGFSGQMKLSYNKFYSYSNAQDVNGNYLRPGDGNLPGGDSYYRRPQFHFIGDFADTLTSRHYSTTITGGTSCLIPTNTLTGNGFTNSPEPFVGRHLNGTTVTNENFDLASGRIASSNFIEYFTNAEIDAANTGSFNASPGATLYALNSFVDYKSSHARSSSTFPAEGIGAFRITGANGETYHYSLPVYELENTTYKTPLNYDYSLPSAASTTMFSIYSPDMFPGSAYVAVKQQAQNKYAIKWLLTAITGPDYIDSNNNHQVDDDDEGYWISYDYQLWCSSFTSRSPYYGYDYLYEPHEGSQFYPLYFPIDEATYKLSGLYGTVNVKKTETYFLNKIRTSSHSAIFIRDIRYDEKGGDELATHNSTVEPAPDLLVKRVALFKNEYLDSILAVPAFSTTAFNTANYTQFDFTGINNNGQFFNESWWTETFDEQATTLHILKSVEFDQDYSLCKKYHGNIQVDYDGSTVLTPPATVASSISVGTQSLSGKLTLNRILTYEYKGQKLVPSTKFDYDKNNLLDNYSNPDFNPQNTDYWGYFKSDATTNSYSRYTTKTSKTNTKAWSLLKITDPFGGLVELEYESNSYDKVLDVESQTGFRGPAFIYKIASASEAGNEIGNTFSVTLEEGYSSPNLLTEFSYLNSDSIANLKKRICIPWVRSISTSSNDVTPSGGYWIYRGFYYGDCTYTVGTGNNISGSISTPTGSLYKCALSNFDSRMFTGDNNIVLDGTANTYTSLGQWVTGTYNGNGFLMLETPVGYTAYGSGIRVKKIKLRNTSYEVYTTEYSYENGVATNEADRFEYPRYKKGCAGSVLRYDFLKPSENSFFSMGTYIGYSKVTIKDLGRINTANGKTETTFIVDPTTGNNQFKDHFNIYSFSSNTNTNNTFYVKTINECVNKFGNIFGATQEIRAYDVNDNMISKTTFDYEITQQGALSENFHFEDTYYPYLNGEVAANSSTVNVLRNHPVVLKSTTAYGMGGTFEKTENLARDEITGEINSTRSTAKNNSSSIYYKVPAYTYYQENESLDFTSAQFRKILALGSDMYSYGNIDSTLTTGSFLTAGYNLYSKTIRQRQYNGSSFTTTTVTLPTYINNRSFIFDGGQGSMNDYGLFNKTALNTNTMNLAASTSSLYWEPTVNYNWKLKNEITLIDNYKNVVEGRDGNNRFRAFRFGYAGYYKTASVSNCNYASFTFAGFETVPTNTGSATIDGDMLVNDHNLIPITTITPHTGFKCIEVTSTPVQFMSYSEKSPGNTLEIGLLPGRIYRTSVWTHTTNASNAVISATVAGYLDEPLTPTVSTTYSASVASNSVTQIGNWILIQIDLDVPENYYTGDKEFRIELKSANEGTVYFDDFILHPVESDFSASVYNPRNGRLLSSIDENGFATNYIYDAMGRVTETWKEIASVGHKKIKKFTYNYARGAND